MAGRGLVSWEQVDEIVDWMYAYLGDELGSRVAAASELFGSMRDAERDRVRARHSELAHGLASLTRRDRSQPMGVLPLAERRAVVLGMFAQLCERRAVGGWSERFLQVMSADTTKYRSLVFEFETAGLFAFNETMKVEFLPEDGGDRVPDDDLVDVECKRLSGRSLKDKKTTEVWRLLQRRLKKVVEDGFEFVFIVEVKGGIENEDVKGIVRAASHCLKDREVAVVQSPDGRIRCEFARRPITETLAGVSGVGLPNHVLDTFHFSMVEMAMRARKGDGGLPTIESGSGHMETFAFRTDEDPDIVKAVKGSLKDARNQLPKDRPSVVAIDAHEPLHDLPPDERAPQRQLLAATIANELGGHGRPTGVVLSAPESGDEDPMGRSSFYQGNPSPSAPFPPDYELHPGWTPASSLTLRDEPDS